jgi:hypothetical protein
MTDGVEHATKENHEAEGPQTVVRVEVSADAVFTALYEGAPPPDGWEWEMNLADDGTFTLQMVPMFGQGEPVDRQDVLDDILAGLTT